MRCSPNARPRSLELSFSTADKTASTDGMDRILYRLVHEYEPAYLDKGAKFIDEAK
jgi:hypothetical protein